MPDANEKKKWRKWFRLFTEQPLIVNVLGGVATVAVLALIVKLTHLVHHVGYTFILLAIGVITLIGGLLLLIWHRKLMNTWQLMSVEALVVVGSALISVTMHNEFLTVTPRSPTPISASCQAPSRVGLTVSDYELQACDCIDIPGIRQEKGRPPRVVETVSCKNSHDAEVYFTGDIWPPNSAYPGDKEVDTEVNARCMNEFARYVRQNFNQSALEYVYWDPNRDTWTQGHARYIACAAYNPLKPVNRSVRGSRT